MSSKFFISLGVLAITCLSLNANAQEERIYTEILPNPEISVEWQNTLVNREGRSLIGRRSGEVIAVSEKHFMVLVGQGQTVEIPREAISKSKPYFENRTGYLFDQADSGTKTLNQRLAKALSDAEDAGPAKVRNAVIAHNKTIRAHNDNGYKMLPRSTRSTEAKRTGVKLSALDTSSAHRMFRTVPQLAIAAGVGVIFSLDKASDGSSEGQLHAVPIGETGM